MNESKYICSCVSITVYMYHTCTHMYHIVINVEEPSTQRIDLLVNPQKYITPSRSTTSKTKRYPFSVTRFVFIFWV